MASTGAAATGRRPLSRGRIVGKRIQKHRGSPTRFTCTRSSSVVPRLGAVARETTGAAYLDLVHACSSDMFPGDGAAAVRRVSPSAAIAANLARRLAPRVTHVA